MTRSFAEVAALATPWSRSWNLRIGGRASFSSPDRVCFSIIKTINSSINHAHIRVFSATDTNLTSTVGEPIFLNAGYSSEKRALFSGQISRIQEDLVDGRATTSLIAHDGEDIYQTCINTSVAAGTPRYHLISILLRKNPRFRVGFIEKDRKPLLRDMVFSGCVKEFFDMYSQNLGAEWSIQDGELCVLKKDRAFEVQPVLVPLQQVVGHIRKTSFGLSFTSFLNVDLRVGSPISYRNNVYKIIKIRYQGDFHRRPWWAHVDATNIDTRRRYDIAG